MKVELNLANGLWRQGEAAKDRTCARHLVRGPFVELKGDGAAPGHMGTDLPGARLTGHGIRSPQNNLADTLHGNFQCCLRSAERQLAIVNRFDLAKNFISIYQNSEIALRRRVCPAVTLKTAIPLRDANVADTNGRPLHL